MTRRVDGLENRVPIIASPGAGPSGEADLVRRAELIAFRTDFDRVWRDLERKLENQVGQPAASASSADLTALQARVAVVERIVDSRSLGPDVRGLGNSVDDLDRARTTMERAIEDLSRRLGQLERNR